MISEEEPVAINRNMLFQNIFIKFANQYKIDVCLLIMTKKQTDYAAILESYFSKRMKKVETSLIDLTGKNKVLSLMLSERKIIICRNDNLVLNKIKCEPLCGGQNEAADMSFAISSCTGRRSLFWKSGNSNCQSEKRLLCSACSFFAWPLCRAMPPWLEPEAEVAAVPAEGEEAEELLAPPVTQTAGSSRPRSRTFCSSCYSWLSPPAEQLCIF